MRILGNPEDADDAVQQALLTAWRKQNLFHGGAALSTWVMRIVINTSCDMLRQRSKQNAAICGIPVEEIEDYAQNEDDNPDDSTLDRLEQMIAALPELYRESIVVGLLSGYSPDEAAAILGCSRNTLYQRIFKAKQLLKQELISKSH